MKNLLLASAALALTAGYAAAEVTVGGDGRLGLIYADFDGDDENDWRFTSRIRISFTASGETDGGLTFGGSVRADHYDSVCAVDDIDGDGVIEPGESACADGGAVGNTAMDQGSVYLSGAFGKISFGDNDSAANAAVGHVNAISLTGLGDLNELSYIGQADTSVLYTYTNGGLGVYLSAGQVESDTFSVAVKYSMDPYSFAIGYESSEDASQISVGANATLSNINLAARYATRSFDAAGADDESQYAVSVGTTIQGASVEAFYRDGDDLDGAQYGLGASYDLGGGASVVGGVAQADGEDMIFDFGVSMSF